MAETVVITGANRGIGLAFCRLYHDRGDRVYGVCRQSSPELDGLGIEQVVEGVDVATEGGIATLTSSLGADSIDVLINNAGILRHESLGSLNRDSITRQFEINALGPLMVTEALLGRLADSAKVVLITSRMGSMGDNSSGNRYGYRMSKAALNMAGISLAHDLKSQGIAVAILHPGLVGTEMIGGNGDMTPDQAAERLAWRIDELNLENSGTFWHSNGERLPW